MKKRALGFKEEHLRVRKFEVSKIDYWVSPKENYALFGSYASGGPDSHLSLPLSNFTTLKVVDN